MFVLKLVEDSAESVKRPENIPVLPPEVVQLLSVRVQDGTPLARVPTLKKEKILERFVTKLRLGSKMPSFKLGSMLPIFNRTLTTTLCQPSYLQL